MSIRTTLTSILTPILLPIVLFFLCYFLFPSFSYEFFGVSFKSPKYAENPNYKKQTEFGDNSYKTTYNVEVPTGTTIDTTIPESDIKNATNTVKNGVESIKNVLEFAEQTGANAQDVINKIRQNGTNRN